MNLLSVRKKGLYCPPGDFYIDPMYPVNNAVVTHAHADHARSGSDHYYATEVGEALMFKRLGADLNINTFDYGQTFHLGKTELSFHSAGHILGSAQLRISHGDSTWVVSGDYKRAYDPTCEPFEVVECDRLVTEATFALPIYQWPDTEQVMQDIYQWWSLNKKLGKASVLFCYALGKAQRVLAHLDAYTSQTVLLHGAMVPLVEIYRQAGVDMLPTQAVSEDKRSRNAYAGELILAPPSANGSAWMRRFGQTSTGFCSGWMAVRGNRRRRSYDRGFVLSDHADWPALIKTISESRAKHIYVTHGKSDVLVRYLKEHNMVAEDLTQALSEKSVTEKSSDNKDTKPKGDDIETI